MTTLNLYRHPLSGHSHRVELLLALLKIDANIIDVDLMSGEQRSPEFLQKNPAGQVPALEDDAVTVVDSNAILVYLASKYDPSRKWLPTDPASAAEVQRFLTMAAGPVASGPAAARLVTLFGAGLDHARAVETAHNVLAQLNAHLADHRWLVSPNPTIADVANYAYVAHAPEGNVDLGGYPNVQRWLTQIEQLPNFVAMQTSPVGLAA